MGGAGATYVKAWSPQETDLGGNMSQFLGLLQSLAGE
jgi:hypothetical protein